MSIKNSNIALLPQYLHSNQLKNTLFSRHSNLLIGVEKVEIKLFVDILQMRFDDCLGKLNPSWHVGPYVMHNFGT